MGNFVARDLENGEDAVQELQKDNLHATYIQADLTDENSFIAIKDRLMTEHGGLDVLVNNAGVGYMVRIIMCNAYGL